MLFEIGYKTLLVILTLWYFSRYEGNKAFDVRQKIVENRQNKKSAKKLI